MGGSPLEFAYAWGIGDSEEAVGSGGWEVGSWLREVRWRKGWWVGSGVCEFRRRMRRGLPMIGAFEEGCDGG